MQHNTGRIMKILLLALVLVLAVTSGFALVCNHCVPLKPGGTCTVTKEMCDPDKDACAAAKFLTKPFSHFQRCINMSGCQMLQTNSYINIKCCQYDLCNDL